MPQEMRFQTNTRCDARALLQAARAMLAVGAADIIGAVTVTQHSRRKQKLLDLLDPLLKLQEAKELQGPSQVSSLPC